MSTAEPAVAPTTAAPDRTVPSSRASDESLAQDSARGSEQAFAALYERYHQPLYRYCRSIVRNDQDAQDALQSTFAGALSALRRDRRSAPLRPWLFRIAHNEAISVLRRRRRDDEQLAFAEQSAARSTEEEAAARARWATLVSDLGELPERQRGALLLRELSGLSHTEIAIALDTTASGAKQAIFEARQALAELEEGRSMSCDEVRRKLSDGDGRLLRGRRMRAHLRACAGCEAFAVAIATRRSDLRAFTPALPSAAAALLFARALKGGLAHAGAGGAVTSGTSSAVTAPAGSGGAITAAAAGKAAGTAIVTKALVGAAVVLTAAAGVTGLTQVLRHHGAGSARPPAHGRPHAARAGAGVTSSTVSHGANGRQQGGPGRGHGAGNAPGGSGGAAARANGVASGARGGPRAPVGTPHSPNPGASGRPESPGRSGSSAAGNGSAGRAHGGGQGSGSGGHTGAAGSRSGVQGSRTQHSGAGSQVQGGTVIGQATIPAPAQTPAPGAPTTSVQVAH